MSDTELNSRKTTLLFISFLTKSSENKSQNKTNTYTAIKQKNMIFAITNMRTNERPNENDKNNIIYDHVLRAPRDVFVFRFWRWLPFDAHVLACSANMHHTTETKCVSSTNSNKKTLYA